MSENPAELVIELSLEGGEPNELDELTRQLRTEVEELNIDSVEQVSAGVAPQDGSHPCSSHHSSSFRPIKIMGAT
jgi:hypothetical protein